MAERAAVGFTATIGVWRRLVAAGIRSEWQYRTSFVAFLVSQAVIACFDLAAIGALFVQVDALAGWTAPEVVLLFGLSTVSFGVSDVVVSPVEMASRHVKAGTFDLFLLRPVPALVHLAATEFAMRRVGKLVLPLVALTVALVVAPVRWDIESVVLLPVTLVSATVLFSALWVITSSIAFWVVDAQEVANAFTYGGATASQYPLDALGPWLRRIVTFVVPVAFVAYLPAARMLGRSEALGMPTAAAWAGPAVAVAFVVLARAVWGLAVRHHRSTGS